MTQLSHARIDADGLLVARLDPQFVGDAVLHQAGVVPAPRGEAPPGQAWQWSGDLGWQLIADRRGTTYADPASPATVLITALLQEPPTGWIPLTSDELRQRAAASLVSDFSTDESKQ